MNIVDYFKKITRFIPIDEQIELLSALTDIEIKNLAVSAGRGFSKTMCSALSILWFADEYSTEIGRPLENLLVSSQKRMYWHLNNFFRDNPYLSANLRQKGMYQQIPVDGFEFKHNFSIVDTALATQRGVRSHRADIVIIDECAEVPRDVVKAAMGCLTGDICKLVLISTCHKRGFFTDVVTKPDKHDFKLLSYSSKVCEWQKEANIRLKKALTKAEYAIEVLGRIPTKAERSVFPQKHLDKCFVVDLQPEGGIREAGLDFGDSVGKTILTITEKLGIRRKMLFQKPYPIIEEKLDDVQKVLEKLNVVIVKADPKPPEYKKFIGNKIGSIPVVYVDPQYHKKQMIGQLQRHVMRHTISIDVKMVDLRKELERYKFHKRSGDDRVDSLAFSVYEFKFPKKPEVRVFL